MRRAFTSSLFAVVFLLLGIGCGSGGDLAKPETQREFGVRMARMNLWREAMFRFRREVQIAPQNAMAHNNLAVALEATGDFDGAAKEYREALRLDRQNQYIQKNYSRFVEFTQKAKKREASAVTTTTTAERPAPDTPPTIVTSTTETTGPGIRPPQAGVPPAPTTTNPPGGSL
ncbi:MAG TPA: tetratricopeptide repeat protein [Thermoanaerobaculia bacterium]